MSTSRTLHLTTSSTLIAAALALTGAAALMPAAQATGLGTSTVSQVSGPHFDIGAVSALRHQQFAQYLVDHALELSQNR